MSSTQIMQTVSFRGYLLLLQAMFLILYGSHLQQPVTDLGGEMLLMIAILGVLTIMVFTISGTQLCAPWLLSVVTLSDASVLFRTLPYEPGTQAGMIGALIVLLAMASYISSLPSF